MLKSMGRSSATMPSGPAQPVPGNAGVPRIESSELLGQTGQLIIDHAGQDYRLRITSNGKLLLTK
jgi:hemin uptake protein HemP